MSTASQEDLRLKQRSNVNLKAVVSLKGQDAQEHQCRLTDLSATGARLHFEDTSSFTVGMNVAVKISIPSTIMHIPNTGEIMWIKKGFKECRVGVKFTEFLSETMIDQLTKSI
jgi:c-di-GMP-binding flagellar brake protein YcgR